jgi:uncharacterized protein (TIGR02001 family)
MRYKFWGVLTTMVLVGTGVARAAEPLVDEKGIPGSFSANVALTSEYFFRGLSQTDDAPALQGGLDYNVDLGKSGVGAYLGVWGSNVDFNEGPGIDGATVEIDLYGGLTGEIGNTGLGWDAGVIYYAYPGAQTSLNYDFVEVMGALSYDFDVASASLSVNYSPDYTAGSGDAIYTKFGVSVPVMKKVDIGAYVGRQVIDNNTAFGQPDYWEWNVSAGVNVAGFDLSLAYTGTDISGNSDPAGDMVIFTVSRSF